MPEEGIVSERMNYYRAIEEQMKVHAIIFGAVGKAMSDRKWIYHRGAFYADVAMVIRLLLEYKVPPFTDSAYNWEWWADELEKRAGALGLDAQYAMPLPAPMKISADDWQKMFSRMDLLWRYLPGIYQQEARDSQITPMGPITPAECAKITHRFAGWLEKWCYTIGTPGFPFRKVVWPWLEQVQLELKKVYTELGEDHVAGGWGPGGGNIPPISWPGAQ